MMRGLIIKTGRFYSRDREKSTWPKGISKYRNFDKSAEEFLNVICVFVCVEKDDQMGYLADIVKRVKELNETFYHLSHVVVIPFAHLSRNLAPPEKATEFIVKLANLLRDYFTVDTITFGTHKDFIFEIPGQPAEVSYFEFPYSGKKPKIG